MIHSKRGGIGIATQSNWVANCEYADVQFANDTNGHAAALELLGANPNRLHKQPTTKRLRKRRCENC